VHEVQPGSVTTDDGAVRADAIIVATDPRTASQLLPQVASPVMNAVTTWYHSTDDLGIAGGRPVLHVDSDNRRPVVNTVVMSHSAPAYAPSGRALIASSVLGVGERADDEPAVLQHLADLYGASTTRWETVGVSRIPDALPAVTPPHDFRQVVSLGDGLFVAGDHRDSSSIQGAMVSGRRTAHAVLSLRGART
jgi:glycine/D-amino acid oxidase-like deaminating enzyme